MSTEIEENNGLSLQNEDEEYRAFPEEIYDDLMREVAKRYLAEKRKSDPTFEFKPLSYEEKLKINEFFRKELNFKRVPFPENVSFVCVVLCCLLLGCICQNKIKQQETCINLGKTIDKRREMWYYIEDDDNGIGMFV